jgi:CRP/FNR family transcriptional regulator, cyclic AMP receptor protein
MLREVPIEDEIARTETGDSVTIFPGKDATAAAVFAARGWLADEPEVLRARILKEGISVEVQAGNCVFRRGDPPTGLYGIVSGAVAVEGGHGRQSPVMTHVFRPGDWFGLTAVLDGSPRVLTYRALEDASLVMVARARMLSLMEANPRIARRVVFLAEIGSRIGTWAVRDLLTQDAGRRLAAVLYRVTGAGEITPDDPEGFRLTHQQLGEMANLSRHHVGRKLAAFEAAGWIACGYNRIRLEDAEGLAEFAHGDVG